ncbi:MAG: trypsin-like serine protease [Bacteroidota bacterium]
MPTSENLFDEVTIEQIKEQDISGVCYQLSTRGRRLFRASFNSTSFFISRNFLLTSAHNVVKTLRSVNKLQISPSRIGSAFHFGTAVLYVNANKHFRIYPDYRMRNSSMRSRYDLAMIYIPDEVLDQNISFETLNHLPLLEDISSISEGETVYCAGYPASGKHIGRYKMTLDSSVIGKIKEHSFTHDLDTKTGNSGSPIMVKRDNKYYVIGVNSIKYNGTLINNKKKVWITESIQDLRNIVNK